jgi:hypothetical protein
MGHRDNLKSGDELDAVYKAPLKVFDNNSGLRKQIKHRINRRNRRRVRQDLDNNFDGYVKETG